MTLEEASKRIDDGEAPLDVMDADADFRRAAYAAWSSKNVQSRRKTRLEMRRAAMALAAALRLWGVR